jgi:GNAT superfamily N-acetyltransferase
MNGGMFWCLFDGDVLIGTVAIRRIGDNDSVCEMKRLYVLPEYQGNGYGELLFRTALKFAKASGVKIVRLDTRHDRSASRHIIEKHRFRQIEQYNQNAFAELFYELNLSECDLEE